jgi:hypothetical protein
MPASSDALGGAGWRASRRSLPTAGVWKWRAVWSDTSICSLASLLPPTKKMKGGKHSMGKGLKRCTKTPGVGVGGGGVRPAVAHQK